MVDHIFNEARSGEVLRELRAEAELARLVRSSGRPNYATPASRARMLAGVVAACFLAAVGAGLGRAI